ncbi:UDP-N-acetylmuramoyl-tripeptide--D-alanyl-D-alanine ligase [Flavobacteriaceae bacterium]|jgi:UDP-N-acetylmuramoyl-tripeptide--D-alanyl-D-alanine ligase|nr:UDP-N-acetylmuramoyl-tripeptide--D-alanyl-D-alanine ligase [Flavobacteriaceae bacterium]MDA9851159.1 UDP-N-acetylmuramoyl-tripeptide--D-alanyl-D-alanine ligase [Flavobacteriaceae bacterium]
MEIEQLYIAFLNATEISTDTRTLKKGALFFALSGPNFDGNRFAKEALAKGAEYVVVSDLNTLTNHSKVFLVKNTLATLQQLANYHRKKLNILIIALTGSNGKTTTKELIREVLQKKFKVLATQGNLNNHIGVPLTLLQLTEQHEIGIIEMGANHVKEIEKLCEIALPNWGYITNFGKAHLEGFGSEEGVVRGKSELYTHLIQNQGQILINGADPKQVEQTKNYKVVQFSNKNTPDFKIEYLSNDENQLELRFKERIFKSPLYGTYNFNNIAAAIAFGTLFEVPLTEIQNAIAAYDSKNNRSQKLSIKGTQIILDAYNANPSSMEAALRAFAKYNTSNNVVIIGDMLELGKQSEEEHNDILSLSLQLGFENIYTLGSHFKKTTITHPSIQKFENLDALFNTLKAQQKKSNRILIKGSRSMKLEQIIPLLESL